MHCTAVRKLDPCATFWFSQHNFRNLVKRSPTQIKLFKRMWEVTRPYSLQTSELSTENKLLIYKTILKPIWTYGILLWSTASNSNTEILQRYQNKVLRAEVHAPWCISNKFIHTDLKVPTIREEITNFSVKYRDKITTHPNELASTLLEEEVNKMVFTSQTRLLFVLNVLFGQHVSIRYWVIIRPLHKNTDP
jgi:hypothetical protein